MNCQICPRRCGGLRTNEVGEGFCGMPMLPKVARSALHHWEEPCISGTQGSGTIFFSGCVLRCVFCQNGSISHGGFGKTVSVGQLREMMEALVAQGAANINLVSPTPYAVPILQALEQPLPVPVVWNTGGYERVETLKMLEGKVAVYLPDLKYGDNSLGQTLSGAADYFPVATAAICEMVRQTGDYVLEDGMLKRGVLIRHLLLPGQLENTRQVLDWIASAFRPGQVLVSLMAQYTPQPNAEGTLARPITSMEYRAALRYMEALGLTDGYAQERSSAQRLYTPDFDLTGIL